MEIRKPCDLLLTNAQVLTMDDQFTVYTSGSVAVSAGQILAVGNIGTEYDPVDTVDCGGRVVMPGLVNAPLPPGLTTFGYRDVSAVALRSCLSWS